VNDPWEAHSEIASHLHAIDAIVKDFAAATGVARLKELQDQLNAAQQEADRQRKLSREWEQACKDLRRNRETRTLSDLAQELEHSYRENERLRRELDDVQHKMSRSLVGTAPLALQGGGVVDRGGFYVYQLLDRHEEVVYIGQSSSLMNRMSGHGDKEWEYVRFEKYFSSTEMNRREGELIHALHPKYNRKCPECGLLERPEAA
jgi:hypothetical protein